MKLHLSVLRRIIELPETDLHKIRQMLDDLGLEVKDVSGDQNNAVFNIETLANRGDHLYALGVAREISARLLSSLNLPASIKEFPDKQTSLPIKVLTDKCSRYSLMEASFPYNFVLTPEIRQVMQSDGAKSTKHPLVDLLNYVQLEIGQPMHAFDKEKLEGEVTIVLSQAEEQIEALDGKSYKVPAGSILIRDRKKTIAVAGIIGCANSMVTEKTQRVLIESASFDPVCVRLTARKMGISTDASYAFERGSDTEAVKYALGRVAYLAQGNLGSTISESQAHIFAISHYSAKPCEQRSVSLSLKTLRTQMNLARLQEQEVIARLKNLGYQVTKQEDLIVCQVPSWRLWDVKYEMDLVEDFVRSHGLNNIKLSLPPIDEEQPEYHPIEQLLAKIEPVLLGNGFNEIVSDSFYSNNEVKLLEQLIPGCGAEHLRITNSIESNITHMRLTNIINLARLASLNAKKGVLCFKAFENAKLFGVSGVNANPNDEEYPFERDVLTLGFYGRWYDNEFGKAESAESNLKHLKGVLDALAASLSATLSYQQSEFAVLHPGKQAEIKVGRKTLGWIGAMHPALADQLDIKGDFLYAELDIKTLLHLLAQSSERKFVEPSELPAIRRDITLKLAPQDFAASVISKINSHKLASLVQTNIVDDFKKTEENFRRVTYRLTFQERERTLQSSEVDDSISGLINHLAENHNLHRAD